MTKHGRLKIRPEFETIIKQQRQALWSSLYYSGRSDLEWGLSRFICHQLFLAVPQCTMFVYLSFARVIDDAKCILVTRVCLCVSVCIFLSLAACLHYCTDPDITWGNGNGCPLVVHYWGFAIGARVRCYDKIARTRNVSECTVLALCLVIAIYRACICLCIYFLNYLHAIKLSTVLILLLHRP